MGGETSSLNPKDIRDLCEQTDFSKDELKTWYKSFQKDCPSGFLSKEQFEQMYTGFFPSGDAEAFSNHVFDSFDANGDGKIEFREFMCALSVMSRGTLDQKLSWAFSLYDIDGNGFITRDELTEIMGAIYRMVKDDDEVEMDTPDELVNRIIESMDTNNDDKLTRVEFIGGCQAHPDLVKVLNPM